VDKST